MNQVIRSHEINHTPSWGKEECQVRSQDAWFLTPALFLVFDPCSVLNLLCDLGQITSLLWTRSLLAQICLAADNLYQNP